MKGGWTPTSSTSYQGPPPTADRQCPQRVRPLEGADVWLEFGVGAPAQLPARGHPPFSPSLDQAPVSLEPDRGRTAGPAHWRLRASFPRSREMVRGCGGADRAPGKAEEGKEEVRKEKGQPTQGPGRVAPGTGLGAVGSLCRRHLQRARRAERKWRVWPRAARRATPSPAVADRVSADVTGGAAPPRGAVRAETEGGGGADLAPGSAPALADSQPSFFPSPAPGPGRRGGGCSPLCNRGVKKCEKRALCYLFGSRKFMPS